MLFSIIKILKRLPVQVKQREAETIVFSVFSELRR